MGIEASVQDNRTQLPLKDRLQPEVVLKNIVVAEMIGKISTPIRFVPPYNSVDYTQPDYAFWDAFRMGKKSGYELGSLFARPIARILVAWTMGKGVRVNCDHEYTRDQLQEFIDDNIAELVQFVENGFSRGDSYEVVNSDGTLTAVPADQVEITPMPLDYRTIKEYKIETHMEKAHVIDRYYRLFGNNFGRSITIRMLDRTETIVANPREFTEVFQVLIKQFPVIHFANDRGDNEIYGHPVYESLLKLFQRYDNVMTKTGDGVEMMGHPVPVAYGMEDPDQVLSLNSSGTETYTDANGQRHERPVIDFTENLMLLIGKGGDFKFASPNPFSQDAMAYIKKLFYIMLEHTGIPEWAWGGAIQSSKASVEAQMPAFILLLELVRRMIEKPLLELFNAWVATKRLSNSRFSTSSKIKLDWPVMTDGGLTFRLDFIRWAFSQRLLSPETVLRISQMIDNPKEAYAEALKWAKENNISLDPAAMMGGQSTDSANAQQRATDARSQGSQEGN